MNPLDQRQRQVTLAAAGLAAVIFLSIWIPKLGTHVSKGQATPALALASGLILSGLLAASVWLNKRYFVGFAALVIAFVGPWSNYFILAIPYAALAGWLVITAGRQAREEAEARRREAGGEASPRGSRSAAPGSDRSSGQRPRSGGFFRRTTQREESPARRKPPPASRRYTPPKS